MKPSKTPGAIRPAQLAAQRERATRRFLGLAPLRLDESDPIDLADDAADALPLTATVRGLRAAEEA